MNEHELDALHRVMERFMAQGGDPQEVAARLRQEIDRHPAIPITGAEIDVKALEAAMHSGRHNLELAMLDIVRS